MRLLTLLIAATALLCSGQTPSQADLKVLVKDSLAFLDASKNKTTEYSYTVRNVRKQFESDGKIRSEESSVGRRSYVGGHFVFRMSEKNGRKLTDQELKEQEDRISRRLGELQSMSGTEVENRRRRNAEQDEWASEVPEALQFSVAGEETIDGRRVLVLNCEPRPGYSPRNMRAKVFEKMKGKLWIDRMDRELVKAEAETFDTVSIGLGILGRVEKGTRFSIRRNKLQDGNWVMSEQNIRFGARVMLVKWMGNEIQTRMSDFQHKSQLSAAR